MQSKVEYFARVVQRVIGACVGLGNIFLIGVMLLVVVVVIGRSFGQAIPGSYELMQLMLVVPIAFYIAYGAISDTHVVVKLVVSRFPKRVQAIMASFTSVLSIVTLALFVWAGAELTYKRVLIKEHTEVLEIPMTPFRGVWVFALLLFCLVILIDLSKSLRQAVKK
jgi:TRAP-type C4-dicarboxylate transport system permease small subunit